MRDIILFEKLNIDTKKCTGCGACYNSCSHGAIEMRQDEEGFLYPYVDEEKCTNCGLCERACPVINKKEKHAGKPQVYAAAGDDFRAKSSSGGIFPLLARQVMGTGGAVFAVKYDDKFHTVFAKVNGMEDLKHFQGSKYVQADTGLVYREVKKELADGKQVLFSGCPCQVAGLYGYLGKEYDNLVTLDIICHGAPSPGVFQRYIKEVADGKEISDVNFRNKQYGWRCDTLEVSFKEGDKYVKAEKQDLFFKGFLEDVINRPSCGSCPFSNESRVGDITVGDCWGIEKWNNKLNDTGGLSWVSLNSAKGGAAFETIKEHLQVLEESDVEVLKANNRCYYMPKPSSSLRKRFFKLQKKHSVIKSLELAMKKKHDVGVAGLYSSPNYGCALSHLSVYNILKSLGYEPLMIERIGRNYHDVDRSIGEFIENHYDMDDIAKPVYTQAQLRKYNALCDTFMVASDQIWKHILYQEQGNYYALDFVEDNKRKLTYGTSFGHDEYFGSDKVREEMKYYLKRLDAIGVREDSGVQICNEVFDVEARRVLDPVLTVDGSLFENLAAESSRNESNYVFSYMLEPNRNKEFVVNTVSEHYSMKNINVTGMDVTPSRIKGWKLPLERNVKTVDWVRLIKDSNFVVTDSFHGMCFAIIFEKPFLVIEHENRGNGRFYSLLKLLGLEDRIVKSPTGKESIESCYVDIDYRRVKDIIKADREASLAWLKENLEKPHDNNLTSQDIMMRKVSELEEKLYAYENMKYFRFERKLGRVKKAFREMGFKESVKLIGRKVRQKVFKR